MTTASSQLTRMEGDEKGLLEEAGGLGMWFNKTYNSLKQLPAHSSQGSVL